MLDFVVFRGSLLRKDFSQQHAKLRNIPLTVSQVIQKLALGMVGFDFECQIEGLARSNNTKILIENNERFSDGVQDSVSKFPGVRDVGELFSRHAKTLPRGGSLPNSQYRTGPTAAEDQLSLYPLCVVGDTNHVRAEFDLPRPAAAPTRLLN